MNYLLKKDVNSAMFTEGFSVVHSQQRLFFTAVQFKMGRWKDEKMGLHDGTKTRLLDFMTAGLHETGRIEGTRD